MRLYCTIYCSLPACRGLSDAEIERLTRLVYRRQPSLMLFPIVSVILLLVVMVLARPLAEWTGLSLGWTLGGMGIGFGIPILICEHWIHRPAVDRVMAAIRAQTPPLPAIGLPSNPDGPDHPPQL